MEKKYWHELPQSEIEELVSNKTTVGFIMDNFSQPDWCQYKDALSGVWGCWSLNDNQPNGFRCKISKEFCETCPEYNPSTLTS